MLKARKDPPRGSEGVMPRAQARCEKWGLILTARLNSRSVGRHNTHKGPTLNPTEPSKKDPQESNCF